MNKKYFVIYGDYRNTYKLYSATDEKAIKALENMGAERITLKEAKQLINDEKERRKYNQTFSGNASITIENADDMPIW